LFLFMAGAFASGAGVIAFADPAPAVKTSVGSRQLVSLEASGGLLVGVPRLGSLAAVTLRAPGVRGGRLIIREREIAAGDSLLELSASAAVTGGLARVTLYFKTEAEPVRLAHARGGKWIEYDPHEMTIAHAAGQRKLTGFVLDGLGLFRLVRADHTPGGPARGQPSTFGAFDADVRFRRAGWHLLWPAIVLAGLLLLSKWLHSAAAEG
jgi:hypothetical protein